MSVTISILIFFCGKIPCDGVRRHQKARVCPCGSRAFTCNKKQWHQSGTCGTNTGTDIYRSLCRRTDPPARSMALGRMAFVLFSEQLGSHDTIVLVFLKEICPDSKTLPCRTPWCFICSLPKTNPSGNGRYTSYLITYMAVFYQEEEDTHHTYIPAPRCALKNNNFDILISTPEATMLSWRRSKPGIPFYTRDSRYIDSDHCLFVYNTAAPPRGQFLH